VRRPHDDAHALPKAFPEQIHISVRDVVIERIGRLRPRLP